MKNKATLTLIELSLMLVIFALAAALCMSAFVWADDTAGACDDRDHALLKAQSAAEVLKTYGNNLEEAALVFGGEWDGALWTVRYTDYWEQCDEFGTYILEVEPIPDALDLLGMAEIRVLRGEICLLQMDVAWQEVIPDA